MFIDWTTFPFKLKIHLLPFVEHVRKMASSHPERVPPEFMHRINTALEAHPELLALNDNIDVYAAHQDFLRDLFSTILPLEGATTSMQSVNIPFTAFPPLVATTGYKQVVDPRDGNFSISEISFTGEILDARILYAYKVILKKFYNLDLKVDHPIICSLHVPETGLTRYFKLTGQVLFMDVKALGTLPEFDEGDLQRLLEQHFDAAVWMRVLPPDLFMFSGITINTLMDVTTEESIARLQKNLIRREVEDPEWFPQIRADVQNLFRLNGLRLGIATLQRNGELNFVSQNPLWNSLLLKALPGDMAAHFRGSVYEEVIQTGQTIIIEDLKKYSHAAHPLIREMIGAGYNNLMLIPLQYRDQFVGLMELASPLTREITGLSLFKISQVKPIFGLALKQMQEEFENRVEAVMLQQFTSIHPAIQWRFREAAIRLLGTGAHRVMQEEIYFEDIYPFYGSLDIRDSSKKRSAAIAQDFLLHLHTAQTVLRKGYDVLSFDILGELLIDIEKASEKILTTFVSGDEAGIALFIRDKINPVITHLEQHYPEMQSHVAEYRGLLRADSEICLRHRQGYEQAVEVINQNLVQYLEQEEKDLQRLFPCYFETYRSDGVEYNIYIGAAIARGRPLDPLYLDNLRLRQLLWTCHMIRKVTEISPQLQALLKTDDRLRSQPSGEPEDNVVTVAPLILAYSTPITLRFRHDEKRLDVDGAYNVRYEVLKKRIDKATVAGTHERVTQPGCIAIIYTRDEESALYEKHLHYLCRKNLVDSSWEKLELDPLPGVDGLRALRVKVK